MTLLGPFSQLVTMDALCAEGPLLDEQLQVLPQAGIRVEGGVIKEVGLFSEMRKGGEECALLPSKCVALPGLIDAHTHICFAGSRAKDYALRLSGVTYQQIAAGGGGILDTVRHTRQASQEELETSLSERAELLLQRGVTTCEVKSGYGLTVDDEIKQLEAIEKVSRTHPVDFVTTCLAAHTTPPEYSSSQEYLTEIVRSLLPIVRKRQLSYRVDIFVEEHAFSLDEARAYLCAAKEMGFQTTLHADQFSRGGARLAAAVGALSADHLEVITQEDARLLHKAGVTPVVLPGASLGLGIPFPPARMLLNATLPLAIASDWNPGSAPMGDLLAQAALLGAAEKLTMAETLAGITVRAAKALALNDRGILKTNNLADIVVFPCDDYREILYHQGALKPSAVYKRGIKVQPRG